MVLMAAGKTKGKKSTAKSRMTVYGRFLEWVRFRYSITQEEQGDIMGVTQGTISNWQKGAFEASWKANASLARYFSFNNDLKRLHSTVFLFGQGTPMPEDPDDMPYGLAQIALDYEKPTTAEEKAKIEEFESRVDKRRFQGDDDDGQGV